MRSCPSSISASLVSPSQSWQRPTSRWLTSGWFSPWYHLIYVFDMSLPILIFSSSNLLPKVIPFLQVVLLALRQITLNRQQDRVQKIKGHKQLKSFFLTKLMIFNQITFLKRQNLWFATKLHLWHDKKPMICNQITFWSRGLGRGRWAVRREAFPISYSNAGCSLWDADVDQWQFFSNWFQMIGDGWIEKAVGDKFLPLISVAFITGAFFKVAPFKVAFIKAASHINCLFFIWFVNPSNVCSCSHHNNAKE